MATLLDSPVITIRERRPLRILAAWRQHAAVVLAVAAVLAIGLGLLRTSRGVHDLLFYSGWRPFIDLRYRINETVAWFAGQPVYGKIETADYPPAAYSILWPFVGWASVPVIRWIWAVSMLALM